MQQVSSVNRGKERGKSSSVQAKMIVRCIDDRRQTEEKYQCQSDSWNNKHTETEKENEGEKEMNTQRKKDTRLGERLVTATESQKYCHSVSQSVRKSRTEHINKTHTSFTGEWSGCQHTRTHTHNNFTLKDFTMDKHVSICCCYCRNARQKREREKTGQFRRRRRRNRRGRRRPEPVACTSETEVLKRRASERAITTATTTTELEAHRSEGKKCGQLTVKWSSGRRKRGNERERERSWRSCVDSLCTLELRLLPPGHNALYRAEASLSLSLPRHHNYHDYHHHHQCQCQFSSSPVNS